MAFKYLNATNEQAVELADVLVRQGRRNEHETFEELWDADPEWDARLIGIKHTLGGDRMEFPKAAMNDPHNVVWMVPEMAMQ